MPTVRSRRFSPEFKLKVMERIRCGARGAERCGAGVGCASPASLQVARRASARRWRLSKAWPTYASGGSGQTGDGSRTGRSGCGEPEDRRAGAEGRPASVGARFFSANLAAFQGNTPGAQRAWRERVFAQIQAMTRPQGDRTQAGLAVERMCSLAGASRASWYRHWAGSEPDLEEAGVRDAI
jgi:hypothetical protein